MHRLFPMLQRDRIALHDADVPQVFVVRERDEFHARCEWADELPDGRPVLRCFLSSFDATIEAPQEKPLNFRFEAVKHKRGS